MQLCHYVHARFDKTEALRNQPQRRSSACDSACLPASCSDPLPTHT
jgi:hypothetical protein